MFSGGVWMSRELDLKGPFAVSFREGVQQVFRVVKCF